MKQPWERRYYNGFSPEERDVAGKRQYAAARRGELATIRTCHACGLTSPTVLKHLEDYTAWGDYWPTCLACHKALHERYRNPRLWQDWLAMLRSEERPVAFDTYNWRLWTRLYGSQDSSRWPTEPMHRKANLTLLAALPLDYTDHVPAQFDRTAGAPILSGQHLGEVGSAETQLALDSL